MPPKSKRQRAFEEAAQRAKEESKHQQLEQIQEDTQQTSNDGAGPSSQSVPPTPTTSLNPRECSLVTPMGSEMSEDSTFDPEREHRENNELIMEKFCGEWVASLDRDDRMSLGKFSPTGKPCWLKQANGCRIFWHDAEQVRKNNQAMEGRFCREWIRSA